MRFTRPDAYRFAPPGAPEAKMPGWLDPSATRVRLQEAQEEEAQAAFAAEVRELYASHLRARELLAEVKYELAWRRLCREHGYTPHQQWDRKWDGQPRDRGRFSFGKMPGLVSKPAFLAPAVRIGIAAQKALERALALFNALSARNAPDATAALKINARVFKPGAKPEDPWVAVERLTKEEVDELCPRRDEVQTLFDKAAAKHRRQDYPTAQARGSAIHKEVEREVNKLNDPDFRAEVSVRDSEDAGYGEKGSKRLDIFENTRKKATVCIHDGKTGLKPLTPAEMTELVAAAHSYYEGTERVIITEVRPGE